MTDFIPALVSEREPGIDFDCVWASGVMFTNALYGANVKPATLAEAKALRAASGDAPNTGSGIADLVRGLAKRYGIAGKDTVTTKAALLTTLAPVGAMAVVIGRPANVKVGPFVRFNGAFPDLHCVFIIHRPGGYWLMDPEAPTGFTGQYVNLADIKLYYEGSGALVDTVGRLAPKEEPVVPVSISVVNISIPQGTQFYDLAGAPTSKATQPLNRNAMFKTASGFYVVAGPGSTLALVKASAVTVKASVMETEAAHAAELVAATKAGGDAMAKQVEDAQAIAAQFAAKIAAAKSALG